MTRTQLNVSIDPELLRKIKQSARISGKSLVNFVSDCFLNEIGDDPVESLDSRFNLIEERLESIEKKLELAPLHNQNTQTFNSQEVKNFNEFVKAIFKKELKRKGYQSMKEAWNDFINHMNCFDQWNERCSLRLKESLFFEQGDLLTSDEMDQLKQGLICTQPIRTGLINWMNNSSRGQCCCSDTEFPSQEQICARGSKLIKEIYS